MLDFAPVLQPLRLHFPHKKGALRGGRPGFPFNMPKRKRGYSYSTEKEYTVQKSYGSPAWKMLVGNDGMLQEFG